MDVRHPEVTGASLYGDLVANLPEGDVYESIDPYQLYAVREYLGIGNQQPDSRVLYKLNRKLSLEQPNPTIDMMRGTICLDLALSTKKGDNRLGNLYAAELQFMRVQNYEETEDPVRDLHTRHLSLLYLAYLDKYKMHILKQPSTLETETDLYHKLLAVGQNLIDAQPENDNYHIKNDYNKLRRGLLVEISAHLLSTRANLRFGDIFQHSWQSLPREDGPIRTGLRNRSGWDFAVSSGGFYDYKTATFVQLKSDKGGDPYEPFITVVRAHEDLRLRNSAEVVRLAHKELFDPDETVRDAATKRLNKIEENFFKAIGWAYDTNQ